MPRKSSMCFFAYAFLSTGIMTLVIHCQGGGWPFSTRLQIESICFWTSRPQHLKVSARSSAPVPGDSHCLSAVLNSSLVKSSIGMSQSKSLSAGGIDVTSLEGHRNIPPIRLGFLRHWSVICNRSCLWVCGCVCVCVCMGVSVTTITRNCVHRSSPNCICTCS